MKLIDPAAHPRADGGTDYRMPNCSDICYTRDQDDKIVASCTRSRLQNLNELGSGWRPTMRIPNAKQLYGIAGAIFTLSAALGSTLLDPAQRELILQIIASFCQVPK